MKFLFRSPESKASLDLEHEKKSCFWLYGALERNNEALEPRTFPSWSLGALESCFF